MDFWCRFVAPLFVIALLTGKLHFVLEPVEISVDFFTQSLVSNKLSSGPFSTSILATNINLVFTYIRARQVKSVKIPPCQQVHLSRNFHQKWYFFIRKKGRRSHGGNLFELTSSPSHRPFHSKQVKNLDFKLMNKNLQLSIIQNFTSHKKSFIILRIRIQNTSNNERCQTPLQAFILNLQNLALIRLVQLEQLAQDGEYML